MAKEKKGDVYPEPRLKILVIEDDPAIRGFEVMQLRRADYEPVEADSGERAFEMLRIHQDIRMCLIDIGLPESETEGFELCRRIRAADQKMGIIMVSARSLEQDKVTSLMTGADDYIEKPFSTAEFLARVDTLFRRISVFGSVMADEIIQGPFCLNLRNRTLDKNGERIKMTSVEFLIMKMFMENPGKAVSRAEILDTVWGRDYFGELKIADVNIRRLRVKVEDSPEHPVHILTEWGYGYKWEIG
ncbi:MAG: response regulator transcription factor [Oscillospiraceae bacterium]|jgi:DNA-binding response OmpR family regulator|nr:response regulator transcription factor [Oscillospiraceae bacterium]